MRATRAAGRRGGFTIAEVLVVLGVLLLAAGLLMPLLSGAARAAREVDGRLSSRDSAAILMMYANEARDEIPLGAARGVTYRGAQPAWLAHISWWAAVPEMQGERGELLPRFMGPEGVVRHSLTFAAVSEDRYYAPGVDIPADIYDVPAAQRRFSDVRSPSEKVMLYEGYPTENGVLQGTWCCIRYDLRGALTRFDGSGFSASVIDFRDHRNFDPMSKRGLPAIATWYGLAGRDPLD